MARNIKITEIGDYANNQMEKLLRAAVLETDSLLKQASPVDTGRFRASWQVGENAAGTYDAGPQQSPSNPGRDKTSAPAAPMFPLRKMNYQQERIGNVYSVHNNLPYAESLANGSSKQADRGFIQGIAKDVQGRVRIAADRIGRES
ncbi:MAG: HK97 gp10 family phage protein [Caulobacteraceae bacterium]|nr:HK97 gp10 family phage protein [Caulobacteraceae bacterium]